MYVCARLYFSAASTYLQLASYYAYAHEKYSVPQKKSSPKGNLYYLKKEETMHTYIDFLQKQFGIKCKEYSRVRNRRTLLNNFSLWKILSP